jgi:MYXO-CTERM domain-containing protein
MKPAALVLPLLLIPAAAQALVLSLLPEPTITRLDQDTFRFEMRIRYTGGEYAPHPDFGYPVFSIPAIDVLTIAGGFGVPFDPEFNYVGGIYVDPGQIVDAWSSYRGNGITYGAFSFTAPPDTPTGNQYWSVETNGTMWWGLDWSGPDSWVPGTSIYGSATIYGALPTAIGQTTTWMATPEPPPLWSLAAGLGLLGIGGLARRRRRTPSRPTEPR